MFLSPDPEENEREWLLPVKVELYIDPDGTVTFVDLAAAMLPVAHALNPDQVPAPHPPSTEDGAEDNPSEEEDTDD